ncbi:MAG: aminotransferase class IV family protein [bacterium]
MESTLRDGADEPGLTLIETLGWTGTEFPRLDLHMARLALSAERLGWPCDPQTARASLRSAAPASPARLRLTLDRAGGFAVQTTALPPCKPQWTLTLATSRLQSTDPWLTLKSSHRGTYDAARAALPMGVDEVIFQNERGELCDGSITTLFFDRGAGLRTPPLDCGLLPGVLRAEINATEERLLASDLPHVRLWVGNSLRGLIPARWIDPRP